MAEAIRGLDQLQKRMADLRLEAKQGTKVLRAAFRQGANVIRDRARQLAPVGTGLLRKKIATFSARGAPGTIRFQIRAAAVKVSPKYPGGFPYAGAVEHGHGAPNARSKKFGQSRLHAEEFGTGQTPPHPFMRPAAEESQDEALRVAGEQIGKGIEKIAAGSL